MKNWMGFIIGLVIALNTFAENKAEGSKILSTLNNQTKAQNFSPDQVPQNFGGMADKLNVNQQDKITKKALEIAASDEAVFQEVVKAIFEPLDEAIQSKKLTSQFFTKKDTSNFEFATKFSKSKNSFDGITQMTWDENSKKTSLSQFITNFNSYLSQFKTIEYVDLSPYSSKTAISQRTGHNFRPNVFDVLVYADIRGIDKKGNRRQDRFEFNLVAERADSAKPWLASELTLTSGESLTSKKSSFEEVKSIANIEPANYLRREAIRRGGYAVSTCDYNNDGAVDLFVGHMGAFEVFKGSKEGKFTKIENTALGLGNDTLAKSIVCNDFDNDGLKDLLVVRFAPSEQKGNDIVLYHNLGGKFAKETSIKNRQPAYYAMPSAVADYNNDGLLDFYIGFPGAKDFTVINKAANGFTDLKESHPQGLFYNLGKFTFNEVTKEHIPYSRTKNAYTNGYPEAAAVFPHTSAGIDYNLDGTMDIVVVDDKANLSPLYKNTGNGNFVQVADKIGVSNYDFGMGFTAADLDNDGYLEFIYSNVNFLPMERLHNSLVNNFSDYSKLAGTYGVRIFKTKDGKNYSDITALTGVQKPGYGIGGVEVVDYNNDGYPDIYVTNGLWSGNTKKQDISSLFSRAYSKFDYDYEEVMGTPEGIEQANTSFMKILTDFHGDIASEKHNDDLHVSMSGFQRNRMYRNNGNGTFTEVGYMLGVDSMNDGYVAVTADLNHDGKMDLLLRNVDPGSEKNKFKGLQVFMNRSPLAAKSVTLTLEGSRSNRDAVGAIVEAKIGSKKIVRHLVANNGSAQSQAILHFGLAKESQINALKIRWPSGAMDEYKNISPGYHHYKEPGVNHVSVIEKN